MTIKKKYEKLRFPLLAATAEEVLLAYLDEFSFSKEKLTGTEAKIVFAHVLRDYLNKNIKSWVLESVAVQLLFEKKLHSHIEQKSTLFFQLLFITSDIVWLEKSSQIMAILSELEAGFQTLEAE